MKTPLELIYDLLAPASNKTEAREAVAKVCTVTRQAVEQWERNGIPGKHVVTLEDATSRKVTAREMLEWNAQLRKIAA
jgi:hypothetical protein